MTDRASLLALALRVEQATGEDRWIDASAAWGVGLFDHLRLGEDTIVSLQSFDQRMDRAIIDIIGPKGGRVRYSEAVPAFTRSLDAALTVYPSPPDMIPADPRKALAQALRARAEMLP